MTCGGGGDKLVFFKQIPTSSARFVRSLDSIFSDSKVLFSRNASTNSWKRNCFIIVITLFYTVKVTDKTETSLWGILLGTRYSVI